MSKICVIDDRFETPAPPFLQEAFEELGHRVVTVYASTQPRSKLQQELENCGADLFVAIQTVGFLCGDILSSPQLSRIKKAILCYDDPMGSFLLFGRNHPLMEDGGTKHSTRFFIWDGYWRKKMESEAGWKCAPTHLAAETKRFSPGKKDLIPEVRHCVVFLGNIPGLSHLEAIEKDLPHAYRRAIASVCEKICDGPYGLNPFEALEAALNGLPASDREQIAGETEACLNQAHDFSKPLASHIQLRRLAWQHGKRETRLRAMRGAARVAPLAILSDLKDQFAAGKDELGNELRGCGAKEPLFVDTSSASYYQLAHLYASGLLHLQSTDPQSVEGGIPYRVFQSAACGVPLLSDYKKELVECFTPGDEILIYRDDRDLSETLQKAISNPKRSKEVGRAAYERFLKEHTWTHRMRRLVDIMSRDDS